MKASSKNVRISPKKAVLIAGMVKQMNAKEALNQLKFTPKKGAKVLFKIITSAVANAKNNFQQDEDKLVIKTIRVTKGITYKRGLPISKGRYHRILKRNSNILVEVGLNADISDKKDEKEEKKPSKKTTAKKEEPKAEKKTAAKPVEKKEVKAEAKKDQPNKETK